MLTKEQIEKFDRDGYLVIPNFFTLETAERLKNRANELLEEFDLTTHPLTKFHTSDEVH